jgi:hypothetical protein
MAEGMSRRDWWSVLGGLLGLFGLGQFRKAQAMPAPPSAPVPPPRSLSYSTYLGGTGFVPGQALTLTYDPWGRQTDLDRKITTMVYSASPPPGTAG